MSDDQSTQSNAPDENSGPKELREALKRAQEQNQQLQEQMQQLTDAARAQAFTTAGIPEDKWGAMFRSAYDGPVDPEAIKQQALENGLPIGGAEPQQEQEPAKPVVSDTEAAAMRQVQQMRTTEPVATGNDELLGKLQQMQASGDFSVDDLQGLLASHNMLVEDA